MSDNPSQAAGSFSTETTSTTTATETHNYEIVQTGSGNNPAFRVFVDCEPNLNVQSDSFDIAVAPADADDIRLQITDAAGNVSNYIKLVDLSEVGNFEKVVTEFVALINVDDDVVAEITTSDFPGNTATVTLTSAKGEAYTAVPSVGAGTMTLSAINSIQVGDPVANLKRRFMTEMTVEVGVNTGTLQFKPILNHYSGAEVIAAAPQQVVPLGTIKHPVNLANCP